MKYQWMYDNDNNITIRIDAMFMGPSAHTLYDYTINPPVITEKTFREIVDVICKTTTTTFLYSSPMTPTTTCFKHLKLSKLTGNVLKTQLRHILLCALTVCPQCYFVNCIVSHQLHKQQLQQQLHFPRYVKCRRCHSQFKTCPENLMTNPRRRFLNTDVWQCSACHRRWAELYNEFLVYLRETARNPYLPQRRLNRRHFMFKTPLALYERLSTEARTELGLDPRTLSYSLQVAISDNRNDFVTVPPFSFLMDCQRSPKFYERFLTKQQSAATAKTTFGTVGERMEKGKYSAVRQYSHNTRYVKSGRAIIVPYNAGLEPDECVLPVNLWRRLECPRFVLAHRYPTLNDRNFTAHRVAFTWIYPAMGITTSIVHGNNADFDGDAMQIIPMTNPASEAEATYLFHPARNMTTDGGRSLRLEFDHDEILTLHHVFEARYDRDAIHQALRTLAIEESSTKAYDTFCRLRRLCHRMWELNTVFTLTYGDLIEVVYLSRDTNYTCFVKTKFPAISKENTIKRIVLAKSCRFSIDHLWQMVGTINDQAPNSSFVGGMTRLDYINEAKMSRLALIKDGVSYAGYGYIKLLYGTRTLIVGYDGRVYTLAGDLVADLVTDLY